MSTALALVRDPQAPKTAPQRPVIGSARPFAEELQVRGGRRILLYRFGLVTGRTHVDHERRVLELRALAAHPRKAGR